VGDPHAGAARQGRHVRDGELAAVCVMHAPVPDRDGDPTGIDKRALPGPVAVGPLGLTGDRQFDLRHHGGVDKALYAYAAEDAQWWAAQVRRPLPPGAFGENLVTRGVDVSGALVGERWRIGAPGGDGVEVEVTMPRVPCVTFQSWLGEPQWVRRFTEAGRPGAYLRVLRTGEVRAGDPLQLVHRPHHDVTVGELLVPRRVAPDRLRAVLELGSLAPDLAETVLGALAQGPVS